VHILFSGIPSSLFIGGWESDSSSWGSGSSGKSGKSGSGSGKSGKSGGSSSSGDWGKHLVLDFVVGYFICAHLMLKFSHVIFISHIHR